MPGAKSFPYDKVFEVVVAVKDVFNLQFMVAVDLEMPGTWLLSF